MEKISQQPFNPKQGWIQKESKIIRALLALPFLAAFYFAKTTMSVTKAEPWLASMLERGVVTWDTGSAPIRTSFYGIKPLDELWSLINTFFTPVVYGYDPTSRAQTRTFLTDIGIIYAIWGFESVRRANVLTFAQLPFIFILGCQLLGIGIVSPIYYFLYYVSTPVEKFKTGDMRLGRMNFAFSLLPTLLLAYYIPVYLMMQWPTLTGRESWLFFWQMSPVWISLGGTLLSKMVPDTTISDRLNAPKRDLPIIRNTIVSLAAFSSIIWIWTCINAGSLHGILGLFVPEHLPPQTTDFVSFIREFLRIDQLSLFGNTFLWLGYLFWDLKAARMLQTSWLTLILYMVTSILALGPGATAGLGWLWREYVLANMRHKDAIMEASVSRNE